MSMVSFHTRAHRTSGRQGEVLPVQQQRKEKQQQQQHSQVGCCGAEERSGSRSHQGTAAPHLLLVFTHCMHHAAPCVRVRARISTMCLSMMMVWHE
jgi:hypothetical protein